MRKKTIIKSATFGIHKKLSEFKLLSEDNNVPNIQDKYTKLNEIYSDMLQHYGSYKDNLREILPAMETEERTKFRDHHRILSHKLRESIDGSRQFLLKPCHLVRVDMHPRPSSAIQPNPISNPPPPTVPDQSVQTNDDDGQVYGTPANSKGAASSSGSSLSSGAKARLEVLKKQRLIEAAKKDHELQREMEEAEQEAKRVAEEASRRKAEIERQRELNRLQTDAENAAAEADAFDEELNNRIERDFGTERGSTINDYLDSIQIDGTYDGGERII